MSSIGSKFVLSQRFLFDPNSNTLIDQENSDEIVRLGSNESRILMMFSERPNEVISREQLHEFVWREQGFQVDDSSLTQAISTLRKNLKDSTKAPQFIKTVPKRGYQFISPVEIVTVLPVNKGDATSTDTADTDVEKHVQTINTTENELPSKPANNEQAQPESTAQEKASKTRFSIQAKHLFIVAALLPVLLLTVLAPPPSKFKLIDTIDGVPLKTTEGHPPMDNWKPVIRACNKVYTKKFPDKEKPEAIIATAGAHKNLILNYIHPIEYSYNNISINLFADKEELSELCK